MLEYAVIGGVVFLAVLAAGGALFMASGLFRPRNASPPPQAEIAGLTVELRHAREKIQDLSEEKRRQGAQLEALTRERNGLREQIVQGAEAAKNLEQRLADLKEAKEQMRQEFGELANQLMKSHGETFKTQNQEQLLNLLNPFKGQIEEFKKQVADSNKDNQAQYVAFDKHIRLLTEQSSQMSQETQNLSRALKGNVQLQGAWGEMVLETILQRSGLREGEEFTSQETHADEEGGRPRTDYIVNLPNGGKIIIDAKVSLRDFEAFVSAEDDATRAARLAAHVASVKSHIKTLAGKEYHAKVGGKLDFVILFMPIESALGAAFERDAEIGYYAADNKVTIATPTTLTIALKTVAAIWRVERQNRYAEEIASRAGKLYDKFVGFLDDMGEIGDRLKQAGAAYDGAMNKLSQGRGNLVGQVEKLKEMGAKANKSIPADCLDDAPLLASDDHDAGEYPGADEDSNGAKAPQRMGLLAP
jgi:DNA recombination protein RmuC